MDQSEGWILLRFNQLTRLNIVYSLKPHRVFRKSPCSGSNDEAICYYSQPFTALIYDLEECQVAMG
ncbi:hypothetical protein Hdeb2414_s0001g00025041 [Helianthus debilis subsp. tardiflorus]